MTTATRPSPQPMQNEMLRILGTIVLAASFFFASWWMAKAGWLDAAAMFLTVFLAGFAKDRMERGLITGPDMLAKGMPETPKDLTGSFRHIRWAGLAVWFGAQEWKDRSPNLRPMIWCICVALAYIAAKLAIVQALTVITNPAMIVLVGGGVVAFLLAPAYFAGLISRIKAQKATQATTTEED